MKRLYVCALLSLFTFNTSATDFGTCVTGRLEDGDDCSKTRAVMDLSACGVEVKSAETKAICWNRKRVAKFKVGKYNLTATFQAQAQWGKTGWALSGVKAEQSKAKQEVAATPAPAPAPAPAPVVVAEPAREPAGIINPPAAPAPAPTVADESLKISGALDVSYIYNFNEPRPVAAPAGPAQPGGNNVYRVFDLYHDDINVNLAEVNFTKTSGDVTAYAALSFGNYVEVLSANDEAGKHITEAKISYRPSELKGLNITVGKMMTHLGLEVVKAKDNWNYSRSILFGKAIPFWHEGIAVSHPVGSKLNVTGYVYNKYDTAYQVNRSKSYGGQLSFAPIENMTLVYNYLGGREVATGIDQNRTLHEINGTYQLTEKLSAGFDVVKGSLTKSGAATGAGDWLAWSVAGRWKSGRYSVSPRYEVYEDPDGAGGLTAGQRLTSETLTFGVDLGGGLETRIEGRRDKSNFDSFTEGNNAKPTDEQITATIGVLYNF